MSKPQFIAHVVSHTHWDREWYRTFEVFRLRLVDLMDALLDLLDTEPTYGPFYLDGQMAPVEDYVAVRPEQAERLRAAFASGRLYSGPWFVQPDEFLVSGEAMVRNLLLGRRLAEAWHTGARVGYAPDAFGHISQMPQILRGFGIDNAVLFRGITADQVPAEFLWRSPDGSDVLCIKMPDDNAYSNWFYRLRETLADTDRDVPIDPERVVREGTALLEDCIAERPMTRCLLWMDGVDHIFPQPRTPEIIRILNERLGDRVQVRAASLEQHVERVRQEAGDLPAVTGELRVANRRWKLQALLAHVASSRIHLKQRNHACETLLERWAEPFTALVWALARSFDGPREADRLPEHSRSAPIAQLRYAWKTLLLNQPHDSICGCSIDQVHRDMLPRYDAVEQVGEALTERALRNLAGWVRTVPPEAKGHDAPPPPVAALVVFNPLAWPRSSEPVEAVVHLPAGDAPDWIGVYRDGTETPALVEEMPPCHLMHQPPHDIPQGAAYRRYRVRFLGDVPAFGYAVYHIAPKARALPVPGTEPVALGPGWMDNGLLRITVAEDGTLTLLDHRTGVEYRGLAALEDGGDFGDGYNYVPPQQDTILRSSMPTPDGSDWQAETSASILGASLTIRHTWYVPAGRDGDGRDTTSQAPIYATITASLRPGSTRLDLDVTVENHVRDHRLRILFPSGAEEASEYCVEQAYDVVTRPVRLPDCAGWREPQPRTGPQKTWLDVSNGRRGLCVVNVGLPECEVMDDELRTAAVTLLRCTGNGVGLPEDQQDSQMQGAFSFHLSLLPHTGTWLDARVWQAAHARNVPLRAAQTGLHDGPLAPWGSLVLCAPETLVPTALKVAEDGGGLIFRAVNLGDAEVPATVQIHVPGIGSPERVRLDEAPCDGGTAVRPRQIATFCSHVPTP